VRFGPRRRRATSWQPALAKLHVKLLYFQYQQLIKMLIETMADSHRMGSGMDKGDAKETRAEFFFKINKLFRLSSFENLRNKSEAICVNKLAAPCYDLPLTAPDLSFIWSNTV
jgi:hypothetical protein